MTQAPLPSLLETVLMTSKLPVLVTLPDLDRPGPTIVAVNDAFCALTQYTREELIGRSPRMFQGPLTDRATLDRLLANCRAGVPFAGEAVNYRKDGTPYLLKWCIDPIRNFDGVITHFVSAQRDITQEKEFARQWLETEQKVRQSLSDLTDLVAALTHTVMVLEKTKRSFKSGELAALRRQLTEILNRIEQDVQTEPLG